MKPLARPYEKNPDWSRYFESVAGGVLLVTLAAGLVFSSNSLIHGQGHLAAESGRREGNGNTSGVASRSNPPGAFVPARALGQIPLSFTVNQGQADRRVKFLSQGPGYTLSLTSAEAVLKLSPTPTATQIGSDVAFKMKLVGSNRKAVVEGLEELLGRSNYFIGKDPRKWLTNVPTYARVKYRDVYPGVDLVYYGNQQELEYDLVVAPRANPEVIKVSFESAEKVELASNGDLVLSIGGAELRQSKPVVYQEVHGENRKPVECRYVLKGRRDVGFALGAYDTGRSLVIDPVLVFSTAGVPIGSITADSSGNVYLTGTPFRRDFWGFWWSWEPHPGDYRDAFVAKLNASGTALVYTTYLGGSNFDSGTDLAVDAAGNAYVVGHTFSADFPTSANALQRTLGGGVCVPATGLPCADVFVAKLNASGSDLIYSTYIGGSGRDEGSGIQVDSAGNAYIAGSTESADFPVTPGTFQASHAGKKDAFVTKINPGGTEITYSTYLGSAGEQIAVGIALDAAGEVYIAGNTEVGFPTTPGTFIGDRSVYFELHFVTRLNASGTSLVYSACFTMSGWNEFDWLSDIAIDSAGNAYVTGNALAPLATNVWSSAPVVLALNPSGSAALYRVLLGGGGVGHALSVDPFGNAYVTGVSWGNLAVTPDAIQKQKSGETCLPYDCPPDAFVAKLSPSGTILYSTYLGGNAFDSGESIALDITGNILVTGFTGSPDFLTTPSSYQSSADVDGFIVKFAPDVSSVSAAHYNISPVARSAIVAAFGSSLATGTQTAFSIPLPTSLSGTEVLIRDSAGIDHPAPLYYVSHTQVNYQVPAGASLGPAFVTVTSADGHVSTGLMRITSVAPALFTVNQSGSGAAAALDAMTLIDAPFTKTRADGQPNIIAFFGTGLGTDATDLDGGIDVSSSVEVTIDGSPARTIFAGSAPGFVGLNQLNIELPIGISSGNHTVVVARNGVKSNLVTILIR